VDWQRVRHTGKGGLTVFVSKLSSLKYERMAKAASGEFEQQPMLCVTKKAFDHRS
jgi:hypothetical protein